MNMHSCTGEVLLLTKRVGAWQWGKNRTHKREEKGNEAKQEEKRKNRP
jgi:hypothetical protein